MYISIFRDLIERATKNRLKEKLKKKGTSARAPANISTWEKKLTYIYTKRINTSYTLI